MSKRILLFSLLYIVFVTCVLTGCGKNPPPFEELVDFVIEAEEGREFRILQLSDIQIHDKSTYRIPGVEEDSTPLTEEELYEACFDYITELVEEAQPDLIILTGDNIHGELDDNGFCMTQLVAYMESLEILWAPVFGNHDNESLMGVTWQCQQFEQAEHCLFKRGNITGNSNYTIGIKQGNKLIKVLYMMDSNGCGLGYNYFPMPSFGPINEGEKIKESDGFAADQVEWIEATSAKITDALGYAPSKFLALHINFKEYADALVAKGYMKNDRLEKFTINDSTGTDFGTKGELAAGFASTGLWDVLKAEKFDGVFAGHNHLNNYSVVYEGIRLTHGTKTGYFSYHKVGQVGGTLITVASGGAEFQVEHIYSSPYTGPSHA